MEIEIRAKIKDLNKLEEKLKNLIGIQQLKIEERQVDVYLKHEKDEERKMIIRIRKKYDNVNGILTFKAKSSHKNDIAWEDYDVSINNAEKLEQLLTGNGFVYVCLIDKVRNSFKCNDFEINVDNIRDLGWFIEIEGRGDKNEIELVKDKLMQVLDMLDIKKEEIIEKGYVQLMIEKDKI